jgi:ABC-type transport system involved in cytochrome c biogenesis permease subunit
MKEFSRFVPYVVAGLAGLLLAFAAVPRGDAEGEMRLREFARLPVVNGGRVQPLDTVARTSLLMISNRQYYVDPDGNSQPAIKWLLEVSTSSPRHFKAGASSAVDLKVFRIENEEVLDLLKLKPRSGFRYAYREFLDRIPALEAQARRADRKEAKLRSLFDVKVLHTNGQVELFFKLATLQAPYALPPASAGEEWQPLLLAVVRGHDGEEASRPARAWDALLRAYSAGSVRAFNRELDSYRAWLNERMPDEAGKTGFETFFNNFAPFYLCAFVYVVVFLLACIGWLTAPEPLYRTAFWLGVVAALVHTWALFARMYLSGRPLVFVTNLYSSAVFIGWMSVLLGLVLERIYRNGVGSALAGLTGALSLVIAHHLGNEGDTLEMLRAVLDTNFWLATHVTTVTIGYSATFVAGFLGIAFIILGFFTPWLKGELFRSLTQMIYGIVCFATLFSFVGTVLGGIWADQSWGRFWGWDPKENGALLIVIWNALILHARWSGMIKQRGMAVLAVGGNMVTAWSWFGTNQLGVGLHAYGFTNTLANWLLFFWISQVVVIALGVMPLSVWRSFAPVQPAVVPAPIPTVLPAPAPAAGPPHVKPVSRKRRGQATGIKKK